ncbi:MAG: DUF177 domain-containing protein [Anaerolineales bacterium]|nr:DUF177 domain-containing protein [Anaerolineales bacterium]
MTDPRSPLWLNLGFIIHQQIGYFREFPLAFPRINLGSDLSLSDLDGTVRVSRTPQGLLVQVICQAFTPAECVRCLAEFPLKLDADFSELYAFNRRSVSESGLILPEDGKINLEPLLREYLLLSIPITPLCRPDCKGLCSECGENLNENTCQHIPENIDPRLETLKILLDKK